MAERFDVVVVGAGFGGMHMLWKLRQLGLTSVVLERGSDVGGTWYWNRYPGARCDVPSLEYSVPWDDELEQEWSWTERYSTQPEILAYCQRLAERNELKRDIRFHTTVTRITFDEARTLWTVETDTGETFEAPFCISAAGCLSAPNMPDIKGIGTFAGEIYHTGAWPQEPVTFKGKRVAVLGTGSTGVQASTAVAAEADHLFVLQRSAQYSLPCDNAPMTPAEEADMKGRYPEHREWQRNSFAAQYLDVPYRPRGFDLPAEERRAIYEDAWARGGPRLIACFADIASNPELNAEVSEFAKEKIREIVKDPAVAEKLCPINQPIGTRRIIVDTGYFQIFNQPNVTLVDIRADPIAEITPDGVRLQSGTFHALDMLIVATGYDAVTGPLLRMNITGRGGRRLADVWADGPRSYLGLMTAGFPNFFTVTGPGSPTVHANVIFSIDQHVNWIADCLVHMRETGATVIEPTQAAQEGWQEHVLEVARSSLRFKDENNWYLGTNVPGKPRSVLTYSGGLNTFKAICDEIAADGYRGFTLKRENAREDA